MNAVLDIGNTHLKVGLFEGESLKQAIRMDYTGAQQRLNEFTEIDNILISDNGNQEMILELGEFLQGHKCFTTPVLRDVWLASLKDGDTIPFGFSLKTKYETPATLGADRIANSLNAVCEFTNQPTLIIDLGTCITYDFVDVKGVHRGGAISPGASLRSRSMFEFTAGLPLVPIENSEILVQGSNTDNALKVGVYHGILGELIHFTEQYLAQYENLNVVLTGGDAQLFEKALKNCTFADPNWTLKGFNHILLNNL